MTPKNLFLTGACLAALAFPAAPNGSAAGKTTSESAATASASPSATMAPTKRGVPYRGKIASVDTAAKTFTITTKKGESRVFKMTDETKIMKDGQPATIADVVADQDVRGQYLKGDDGTMTAKSVRLGMNQEGGRKGRKKMTDEGVQPSPTATP